MQILGVPFLRSRHLPRVIVLCGLGLIFGMAALFGGAVYWLHQQAIRDAESRLAQINLALSGQVERGLESIDTVLQTIAAVATRGDLFDPAVMPRMQSFLANQVQTSPLVRSYLVMDENGDLRIDSGSAPTRVYNGADRENFQFLKNAASRDVHLAAPLVGRLSGEWLFTLSRRLEDRDGQFKGIIASVVDVHYFVKLFDSMKLGEDSRITLWRNDGTFLVGTPFVERRLGKRHEEMEAWIGGLGGATDGVIRQSGLVSGEERISAFSAMQSYPSTLTVSRSVAGILAPWRGEAYALGIFALIASLILAGIGWVLMRMAKAQETLLLNAHEARAHAEYASKLAERANRQKTKFFSAVSHDLRTPLCTISGFSDLMLAGHAGALSEKGRDYVESIQKCGKYLLELLNDLLDMGKIEAGRLSLSDDEFGLRSIVLECLRQSTALASVARVALAPYAGVEFGLRADPLRIRQILFNLLSNAIKFTPAGGRVEVAAARGDDGSLRISVIDSGIGMRPEEIETALEPYGQIRNDFTRTREGTGLGLPLVKALAEMHGGKLEIDSVAGQGTTVTVVLPPERVLSLAARVA